LEARHKRLADMKYIIYFSALLLFNVFGYSQNPLTHAASESYLSYYAVDIQQETLALAGGKRSCTVPYLEWRDTEAGQLLGQQQFNTSRFGWYTDVRYGTAGKTWAVGQLNTADDVIGGSSSVLRIYGADLSLQEQHEIWDEEAWWSTPLLEPTPNGMVWKTGSKLYFLDAEGAVEDSLVFEKAIRHFAPLPEARLLLQLEGSDTLAIVDKQGQQLAVLGLANNIKDVLVDGPMAYWLTDGFFYRRNTLSGETSTLPVINEELNRLSAHGPGVLLYGSGADQTTFLRYAPQDDSLSTVGTWQLMDRILEEVVVAEGVYHVVGQNTFTGAGAPHDTDMRNGFVQRFTDPDSAVLGLDLALNSLSITVDSVYLEYNEAPQIYQLVADITAHLEIQNLGNTPFQDTFVLGSNRYAGFNCDGKRYYAHRTANIAPGGTATLEASVAYEDWSAGLPPAELDYEIDFSRCFFLGAPNEQVDPFPRNNWRCAEVEQSGTLVANHQLSTGLELQVYPNPAQDRVAIEYGPAAGVRSLQLLDLRGVLAAEVAPSPSGFAEFDLAGLASGLYVLRIETERGIVARRLAVAH
jgi:hypothetical protein